MEIYITNLGKYNEGDLIGEWISLPISDDELENVLERIGINEHYEEYFITDYDFHGFKIDEYDSIEDLNEMAERVENLNSSEIDVLEALSDYYDFEECMEIIENGDYIVYSNVNDMSDIAYQYINESGLLQNVPDELQLYFNYDAYGRDMEINGHFHFFIDGCVEVIR